MTVEINRGLCCYCGGCTSVCPVAALTLKETRIEWDKDKCIHCGACELVCPVGAIKVKR
ncbi:MAG: 4Fe-4S binding protein [Candidatus Diapherotrites archaeon]|nr:4Fe-4S binding protein [Candidatus Diapherotrites archaeon]